MAEVTDGDIRRVRNLNYYHGKTDEEIRASLEAKRANPKTPKIAVSSSPADKTYEQKFKEKLKLLQDEFAVDMNDANDRESLNSLVRHMLQGESADEAIRAIHQKDTLTRQDFLSLKDLGEYQGSVNRTISDLQEKLGISRKQRKEKASDDIPQWIETRREKAKNFFERQTTRIECPKDKIMLFQFWENFSKVQLDDKTTFTNKVKLELVCWKCHETVIYNK